MTTIRTDTLPAKAPKPKPAAPSNRELERRRAIGRSYGEELEAEDRVSRVRVWPATNEPPENVPLEETMSPEDPEGFWRFKVNLDDAPAVHGTPVVGYDGGYDYAIRIVADHLTELDDTNAIAEVGLVLARLIQSR